MKDIYYAIKEVKSNRYLSHLGFDKNFNGIVSTCSISDYEEVMITSHINILKPILEYLGDNWEQATVKKIMTFEQVEEYLD